MKTKNNSQVVLLCLESARTLPTIVVQCFCLCALGLAALAGEEPSDYPPPAEVTFFERAEHGGHGKESAVGRGRKLFKYETFAGNGRTCLSCHGLESGTLSPEQVQARLSLASGSQEGEGDALFRPIDSDDGLGEQFYRLLQHATIRVHKDLPDYVGLESDSSARSVAVNRGIPSVLDSGLIEPLMQDGRMPDLETQALGAVLGHFEPRRLPTDEELDEVAQFERTLFSRPDLARYFRGGSPPKLPEATTPEQIRGRRYFEAGGLCNLCHSGPMLNQTSPAHPAGAGQRFENIFVSERNAISNATQVFLFQNADGTMTRAVTPDPGHALVQREPIVGLFTTGPINFFRTPTLWNIKNTAPYFHDNSAKTLEEVLQHYQLYLPISDQEASDIIAFLKLL